MTDLHTLTDDELNTLRIDVTTEMERREYLAAIPRQMASLAAAYISAGGEQADLDDAVAPTPVEDVPVELPAVEAVPSE